MHIREYQQWLAAWDKARGWDRVLPAHTLAHAFEEMGEVAALVLAWEGYKENLTPEAARSALAEELSDVFVFLFKLAQQFGVDVEDALAAGREKADARYPDLEQAGAALERYLARQRRLLGGLSSANQAPRQ